MPAIRRLTDQEYKLAKDWLKKNHPNEEMSGVGTNGKSIVIKVGNFNNSKTYTIPNNMKAETRLREYIRKQIKEIISEAPKPKVSKKLDTVISDLRTLELEIQKLAKEWKTAKTSGNETKAKTIVDKLKLLNQQKKEQQEIVDLAIQKEDEPELEIDD